MAVKHHPTLDPRVDPVGAAPERPARAMIRRVVPLRPARVRQPVAGGRVAAVNVAAGEPDHT